MKPAMYIFINRGLGMSPGKIGAQAGHAAAEATLLSAPYEPNSSYRPERKPLWNAWREGLHYAKYVMEARDTEHILLIDRYLNERGFRTHLVIDEGHTEVPSMSATALGVALVDKDDPHTSATFSSFKLYRDEEPKPCGPEHAPTTLWGYPITFSANVGGERVVLTPALRFRGGKLAVSLSHTLDIISDHQLGR
jgi:peptidyl-tRNA hydrolase